jgi:hypothetical protein
MTYINHLKEQSLLLFAVVTAAISSYLATTYFNFREPMALNREALWTYLIFSVMFVFAGAAARWRSKELKY